MEIIYLRKQKKASAEKHAAHKNQIFRKMSIAPPKNFPVKQTFRCLADIEAQSFQGRTDRLGMPARKPL